MWKLLWGYIVGRGRKKPHIEPAPAPVPVPTPVPAPTPVPVPVPVPIPAPPASDFTPLAEAGYVLPYAHIPDGGADYATAPTTHSVTLAMGTTGGREDLGKPLSGWDTRTFLNGPGSNAYKQTLLNAATHALFPIHYDDASGSPHNIDKDPFVKLDGRDGFVGRILTDTTAASFPGQLDTAHHPELAYMAFLAATDPVEIERWLRVIQWQGNFPSIRYGTSNGLGTIHESADEVRSVGHCLMLKAIAAVATRRWEAMGLTPSRPLLSADYCSRKLENDLCWLEELTVKSSDPLTQAFRIYPITATTRFWGAEQYALWMANMTTKDLGTIARWGSERARRIFDWAMVGIKAQQDSGFDWRFVYKVDFRPDGSDVIALTWPALWANRIPIIADAAWDVGDFIYAILCHGAAMGDADAARRAELIRAPGFKYWQIGNFFDPMPRPIASLLPNVSPDAHYKPFIVTDAQGPNGMEYGREYIATTPGQTLWTSASLLSTMAAIVHTGPNYTYVFYNGPARTNYDFIQFADRKYDVKNRAWL